MKMNILADQHPFVNTVKKKKKTEEQDPTNQSDDMWGDIDFEDMESQWKKDKEELGLWFHEHWKWKELRQSKEHEDRDKGSFSLLYRSLLN